jgi:hypothetical protein
MQYAALHDMTWTENRVSCTALARPATSSALLCLVDVLFLLFCSCMMMQLHRMQY